MQSLLFTRSSKDYERFSGRFVMKTGDENQENLNTKREFQSFIIVQELRKFTCGVFLSFCLVKGHRQTVYDNKYQTLRPIFAAAQTIK